MLDYVQNTRGNRGARIKMLMKKESCVASLSLSVYDDIIPLLLNHAIRSLRIVAQLPQNAIFLSCLRFLRLRNSLK